MFTGHAEEQVKEVHWAGVFQPSVGHARSLKNEGEFQKGVPKSRRPSPTVAGRRRLSPANTLLPYSRTNPPE